MFIVKARNVTPEGLENKDGLAHYDVWVGVNDRPIWTGVVHNHVRSAGAVWLLRLIANHLEVNEIHQRAE